MEKYEDMKAKIITLEQTIIELKNELEYRENNVTAYRKEMVNKIINNELDLKNPINVPIDEFCKIYNDCMDKYFDMEDSDSKEALHIMNSFFCINWNGIKCEFYNAAVVSNEFIPALKEVWEEMYA